MKSPFVYLFQILRCPSTTLIIGMLLTALLAAPTLATNDDPSAKPFALKGYVVIQLIAGIQPDLEFQTNLTFGKAGLDQAARELKLHSPKKVFPWRTDHAGASDIERNLSGIYQLQFPDTILVAAVVEQLLGLPEVLMAEPVWIMPIRDEVPNDPSISQQWFVNNISLPEAWSLQTASDTVKLAMVDTGVNYKHPDLKGNIWVNPGEDIDGDGTVYDEDDLNGVDDDGNGIVDDLIGYDFLTNIGIAVPPGEDAGSVDPDPMDFHGHGTHLSGISAAMTNNATGGVGLAGGWSGGSSGWSRGARIMCLRTGAASATGQGYVNSVDCATAIDYATMMGADVINSSWGGSSVQHFAVVNAYRSGVLVVHAAGNDGDDLPDYLDIALGSQVMSVASTTSTDKKSYFSNYGEWVDISAPGDAIMSTVSVGTVPSYAVWSGTSMAAPMVGGLALLIRSVKPDIPVDELTALIQSSADNIDDQNPGYVGMLGAGRINVARALSEFSNANFTIDKWQGYPPFEIQFTDLSPNAPNLWNWSFGNGDFSNDQHPLYTYELPGVYSVSLDVSDTLGDDTELRRDLIWVHNDSIIIGTGSAGWLEQVEIPVYYNNSAIAFGLDIVFTYHNLDGITWISANVDGLRTESAFTVSNFAYSPTLQSRGIRLTQAYDGAALFPDTGAVVNLVFQVPYGVDASTITLDTISWSNHSSRIQSEYGEYWPAFQSGTIDVIYTGCCGAFTGGLTGNTDCDLEGKANLADITRLIDKVYISQQALCCPENGNTDGDIDGKVNLADITRLIDHVYISGQPTEGCE